MNTEVMLQRADSDMEHVVETSANSFDREVKRADKPAVVEFWTRSCSDCQKLNRYVMHTSGVRGWKYD